MSSLAGGVDEAGRGCIVGPLVVAGVSASRAGVRSLKEMGVKDSKLLSPRRREALYPEILRVCGRHSMVRVPPAEIDAAVGSRSRKLNYLEAVYFAKVIERLGARQVTVDACDVVPGRFGDAIRAKLKSRCKVTALHKADRDFVIVSAASVVAKVERDRAVEELRRRHGDFGSGYPSDPKTRAYFTRLLREGGGRPDWTRKSWGSWERFQQTLLTPP